MNEKVLLDKVFDAGANTIWSEMKKLRGHAPEYKIDIRRRWIWELVQNASDCAFHNSDSGSGINIIVNYAEHKGELTFTHDGKPFKYSNLIDLITQISSKQSDEDKKTGKFGTGFISTHLLSETVKLTSFLLDDDGSMKEFDFIIDRSGTEYQDIRENIIKNLNYIEEIQNSNSSIQYNNDKYSTTFTYFIENEDAKQAILVGLEDLKNAAPFVLSINPSICSINCNGVDFKVSSKKPVLDGTYNEIEIKSLCENFTLLCKKQNKVSLVFSVKKINSSQFKLLPYPKNFPKLFCNFPLIGTEKFSFPMLINCADFEVKKDRNAIYEGNKENIQILTMAKELYFELLDCVAQNKWYDIFNICFCENNVDSQLQHTLYKEVFEQISTLPIVNVNFKGKECGFASFSHKQKGKLECQIGIPQIENMELNDEFWKILNRFSKFYIPSFSTYKEWGKIFTNHVTVSNINDWYFKEKCFLETDNCCHSDCYEWLNTFYSFWIKSLSPESFYNEAWVLNQNNEFKLVNTLFVDSEIDEELKNILNELDENGENIRGILISKQISIPKEANVKSKDNKYITKCIQDKINKLLSEETVNNVKRDTKTQLTFNKLTNWFLVNAEKAEELFDTLYNKRNMLSTIEENIRRFRLAEKIESTNITNSELDLFLDNHIKISELLKNHDRLSAEEIKEKLQHISLHNDNALEFYEKILERTISKVHQYLTESIDYQIADTVEGWKDESFYSTVFPAIKEGKELRIVIRPSDDNKIIFFHNQELSALDDTDYELWTDNENGDTRMITLGDLLRTTGITVIPLKRFY